MKKKKVLLIIALVIGAIVAFFVLYILQPMMPWKVNRLAKITDEYMRNKYDFEVERTGYHVNLLERSNIYRFFYKKIDEPNETIMVYISNDATNIGDCSDDYVSILFYKEYGTLMESVGAEIFGNDALLTYQVGKLSVPPINTYLNDWVDAGISIEIIAYGYEEEKNIFADDVIRMINEIQNMGLRINDIQVKGSRCSYRTTNPSDSVSVDDLEYFEYNK